MQNKIGWLLPIYIMAVPREVQYLEAEFCQLRYLTLQTLFADVWISTDDCAFICGVAFQHVSITETSGYCKCALFISHCYTSVVNYLYSPENSILAVFWLLIAVLLTIVWVSSLCHLFFLLPQPLRPGRRGRHTQTPVCDTPPFEV